ncbi:gamma-glutamyltransferase family protein [Sphingosinicella soli]|uniref:Gamma-glutamyltranspeptidase/glutathione hydrolase n=1 Tax=Sphingosinicella soli TaxID=333708 RepID=A0A7W7B6C8_9SPHN|nr:gamma-glutamyltransferase [Sphingosinicella soli]MBB4633707.1 gamma-glutamyltranspeptidase/glutathione hydrolase [Sphingosinicella soli]
MDRRQFMAGAAVGAGAMIASTSAAAELPRASQDLMQRYVRNPGPKTPVTNVKAACSTDNAIVTETILKVMREGGNAVDAAIAGCMVQATVEPFMTNHTGTVTFLYYEAKTGKLYQLDSTGTFPSDLPPFRPVPAMPAGYAAYPPSAVIPGFMPGLKEMFAKFGTKPWAYLCEDAIRWAESGHPVSTFEVQVNEFGHAFYNHFPDGRRFFAPDGYLVKVGDLFVNKPLAATLRKVAAEGPEHMITGGWADAFIARGNAMGWNIEKRHMTETPPRWIEPLRFRHHEYEVVSLAPPQNQGVRLAGALGILRHLKIRDLQPGSAEHLFYMGHALRHAIFNAAYSGDPVAVADYDTAALLDEGYFAHAARLIRGIKPKVDLSRHVALTGGATGTGGVPTVIGAGNVIEKHPPGSCELAIVDAEGNWVQMMNTLQSGGIPGVVVGGVPMVGSHCTFNQPEPSMMQLLAPGARMRQVMGNTIVLKNGKPVLSLGTPGAPHYTVAQVLTHALDFNMSPYAAAEAPRMYPINDQSELAIEDRLSADAVKGLAAMGVKVRAKPAYDYHMGSFQMCFRDAQGRLGAVADPRRMGVADGLKS